MSSVWICCIILMAWQAASCWGCIPTPQHDEILIPPHPFTCEDSAGAFIENAVHLFDSSWGLAESQVCQLCPPAARLLHFSSTTNAIPDQITKDSAGTIDFATCKTPCVCDFDFKCYRPDPTEIPDMTLYPFCDTNGCFLTVILTSSGQLAKDDDPLVFITYEDQRDAAGNLKPVTDEAAFPRIQTVGCEDCDLDPLCPNQRSIEI